MPELFLVAESPAAGVCDVDGCGLAVAPREAVWLRQWHPRRVGKPKHIVVKHRSPCIRQVSGSAGRDGLGPLTFGYPLRRWG